MRYATLHNDGKTVKEVFHKVLYGLTLNRTVFECPDNAAEFWQLYQGQIVPTDHAPMLKDEIDAEAGRTRLKYITQVPGQEATYIYKGAQAAEYKAAGYQGTVPIFIQAEAAATGLTAQAAADNILLQEAMWLVKGSEIEQARIYWKLQIDSSLNKLETLNSALEALKAL